MRHCEGSVEDQRRYLNRDISATCNNTAPWIKDHSRMGKPLQGTVGEQRWLTLGTRDAAPANRMRTDAADAGFALADQVRSVNTGDPLNDIGPLHGHASLHAVPHAVDSLIEHLTDYDVTIERVRALSVTPI